MTRDLLLNNGIYCPSSSDNPLLTKIYLNLGFYILLHYQRYYVLLTLDKSNNSGLTMDICNSRLKICLNSDIPIYYDNNTKLWCTLDKVPIIRLFATGLNKLEFYENWDKY